jgi:hypothetical protein
MTDTVKENRMRTLKDVVLEHAALDTWGTDDGIRILELDGAITQGSINGAANLYLTALSMIRDYRKQEQAKKAA